MNISEAKKQAQELIENAVDARIEELKKLPAFEELKKQVQAFENDGSEFYGIDEGGMLESSIDLDLSDFADEDSEVIEELLKECSEVLYFHQTQYSQGKHEWTASQCHGFPILYYPTAGRNEFELYSEEFKDLRIMRVKSSRHAELLIEQAMRKAGYFPNVMRVLDRYGFIEPFKMTTGTMTDEELKTELAAIEADESEEE